MNETTRRFQKEPQIRMHISLLEDANWEVKLSRECERNIRSVHVRVRLRV